MYCVYDIELFLVCGKDGVVRVFVNVCCYCGVQLVEGWGVVKFLMCLFYVWMWNLDGFIYLWLNSFGGFDDVLEVCD